MDFIIPMILIATDDLLSPGTDDYDISRCFSDFPIVLLIPIEITIPMIVMSPDDTGIFRCFCDLPVVLIIPMESLSR